MIRRSNAVRPPEYAGLSRRLVLRHLAGLAGLAAGAHSAFADDRPRRHVGGAGPRIARVKRLLLIEDEPGLVLTLRDRLTRLRSSL